MRYATVTAAAQGTSYAVFAALVLTVLAWLPQAALVIGAVGRRLIGYNGHRLFAFAPKATRRERHEHPCRRLRDRRGPGRASPRPIA